MDNAKVMEALEKHALLNYFEQIAEAKIKKITLFTAFPYTAAVNYSDPHSLVIIEELDKLAKINGGAFLN